MFQETYTIDDPVGGIMKIVKGLCFVALTIGGLVLMNKKKGKGQWQDADEAIGDSTIAEDQIGQRQDDEE